MKVVIFSSSGPAEIDRLVRRIHLEVPEARVCGVLYERRAGKPLSRRISTFARNLFDADFWPYVAGRVLNSLGSHLSNIGATILQFVHATPCIAPRSETLENVCRFNECRLCVTTNFHSEESLQFVRELQPDLGIVYATRILKPCLFDIPRLGSINIHKRKVPDYRGGGPVGLWELLDNQVEIGVTVHQVTVKLDAGAVVNSATIPIEPYDTLTSLALKAHVIGNDLIVRSVADFARDRLRLRPQREGAGQMFKNPSPQRLARYTRELKRRRPLFRPSRGRSTVKLLARTILKAPKVAARNRQWRKQGAFPVVVLFHHLVSDREHRMGISTDYFLRHVQFLQKYYRIVSLTEAIDMVEANNVTEPTVVLTFDDGYRENSVNLRAIVEKTGIPVTMFISTEHINSGEEFYHDVRRGIQGFRPLTWEQVVQMKTSGCEIGSHTRTHFDCGSGDRLALHKEIFGSREDIEARLDGCIQVFSFPFGLPANISREAIEIASESYPYFCSAFGGYNFGATGVVVQHIKRWPHPNSLWLLELQLQDALEPERAAPLLQKASPERIYDQGSGHHLLQQRLGQRSSEQEAHHAATCERQSRVVGQLDR